MFNLTVCSIEKDKDPTDRNKQNKSKINLRELLLRFATYSTMMTFRFLHQ